MATINKPFTFSPGTKAKSAEVNADFDTLYGDYNGNIDNSNISVSAAIAQSKILGLSTSLAGKVGAISIQSFGISGIYTKPSNVLFVRIICIGGGGGGGGAQSASVPGSGGGGGSGAYTEAWFAGSTLTPTVSVTIGTAGAAGVGNANGGNGGTTSFGAFVSAGGGGGGFVGSDSIGNGGGGAVAGSFSASQFGFGGMSGTSGFITTQPGVFALGGTGGHIGPYQLGGQGFPTTTAGNGASGVWGGGGGGAARATAGTANGGDGGLGLLLVVEFLAS